MEILLLIFPVILIIFAIASIVVAVWSLIDLIKNWDSVEGNIFWLLGILLISPIVSFVYWFVVYKKRYATIQVKNNSQNTL